LEPELTLRLNRAERWLILTLEGKMINNLTTLISLKMAERSEGKSAKLCAKILLIFDAVSASLIHFQRNKSGQIICHLALKS